MKLSSLHKAIKSGAELTVEQKFLKQLTLTIQEAEEGAKSKPSTNYKPSSLNCPRQMFYYRRGTKADSLPSDYKAVGIAQSGTDRHIRLQEAIMQMKEFGYDCEYVEVADYIAKFKPKGTKVVGKRGAETKCFNDIYNISFMCDGILRIGGVYYVLEIKTENSYKFSLRAGVDEKHYNQAICYSLLMEIDNVIFLYENRDICDKKCFMFTVTPKMCQKIIDKLAHVEKCIADNKLPEKITVGNSCNYCAYRVKCKMEALQ